jgi:hypothetical protein
VQRTVIFVILREIATNIAVRCTFTNANSLVFYYKYFGALHLPNLLFDKIVPQIIK